LIRDDPRVPIHLLPPHWPAIHAQKLFRSLHAIHDKPARALARDLLETVEPRSVAELR
jgi:phenylacetic acid degradation operon negative regulatory protein